MKTAMMALAWVAMALPALAQDPDWKPVGEALGKIGCSVNESHDAGNSRR